MHTDENVKIVFIYFGFEFALCRVRLRSKGSNKNWGFYSHIWYRHNSAIHIVFLNNKTGIKRINNNIFNNNNNNYYYYY